MTAIDLVLAMALALVFGIAIDATMDVFGGPLGSLVRKVRK